MNYPNRIIKTGEASKPIVKAVQVRLNELGFGPLEVIGIFGPKTTNAVRLFQATHRDQNGNPLEVDGKLGSVSWAALFEEAPIHTVEESSNKLLAEAVKVALSQVGVMEDPPGSNRGQKVEEYLASTGLGGGNFWCAAFIYWCFKEASENIGKPNPLFKTAHCMTHWNKTTGKKIAVADAVNKPSLVKPGHIFILNTGGASGHTGLVEKVEGGFIHTIEGNSNPAGSSNGIGVFKLTRKINKINRGFIEYK